MRKGTSGKTSLLCGVACAPPKFPETKHKATSHYVIESCNSPKLFNSILNMLKFHNFKIQGPLGDRLRASRSAQKKNLKHVKIRTLCSASILRDSVSYLRPVLFNITSPRVVLVLQKQGGRSIQFHKGLVSVTNCGEGTKRATT